MNTLLKNFGTAEKWKGYDAVRFDLDDRESIAVMADSPLRGNPWIWRVRFFNADHSLDIALLRRGFHLAHTDISGLAGGPEAMRRMDSFYSRLTEELNFSRLPVLEAYSRGAMPALNWGIRNPDRTAVVLADNPICNPAVWPRSSAEKELCRKAGILTPGNEIIPEWNPVANLAPLIGKGVPVIVVYDENDPGASSKDNAELLLQELARKGGNGKRIVRKDDFSSELSEQLADLIVETWKEQTER